MDTLPNPAQAALSPNKNQIEISLTHTNGYMDWKNHQLPDDTGRVSLEYLASIGIKEIDVSALWKRQSVTY